MKIDKNHEIIGKTLEQVRGRDIGSLYPVLADDLQTIIGVYSAEEGTPSGYVLDDTLQAFVCLPS